MKSVLNIFWNCTFSMIFFSSILSGQVKPFNYNNFHSFSRYFDQKEYKSLPSNWCILQDKRGVMYFGNDKGIIQYDGVSWNKIETPYSSLVRSLAIDENGKIFVCASYDFGYLEPDSIGKLKFKSLKINLDEKYQNLGEIWDVITNSNGIYFKTDSKILRWHEEKFSIIDSVYSFRFYKIGDDIYTRNNGKGLMKIEGDSIFVIPGGEFFEKTGVFDMLLYGSNNENKFNKSNQKILITTNYNGLFLYNGKKFSSFKTETDSFFINNQIYNACKIENDKYAFATQRGGVAIIDQEGHLVKLINDDTGLPTNIVYDVYYDGQGGLWMATNNGIVYYEYPSSFSIIPNKDISKSQISFLLRFNDILYAVNDLGILYLDESASSFKLVEGSNKPGMHLLDFDGVLLAATNWGVGIVENNNLKELITSGSSNILLRSKFYSDRIFVGHRTGLTLLRQKKNKSEFDIFQIEMEEEIYSIVEDSDKSLWLLSDFGILIHINDDFDNLISEKIINPNIERYTQKNGLPGNSWSIFNLNDKMLLLTDKGVYNFNKKSKSFVQDSIFGENFTTSSQKISLIEKNKKDNLWILAEANGSKELGKAVLQNNGQYLWKSIQEFNRLELGSVTAFYIDYDVVKNKEILWLSTEEGLIRYEPNIYKQEGIKLPTLIRKVIVNNDSLIFGGSTSDVILANKVVLPSSENDIRFEFSVASYQKSNANQFQYFLEGADDDWSNWRIDVKREYANLSGGEYKFRVRAKNIYGIISEEDVFSFKILPPWYLSWWAYLIYGIILLAGIYITDRIMRSIVIAKERSRAKIREAELIKKQAEELEIVDRLVRVINNAADLEKLFNSLLEHTIKFIPQAEKAAIFLFDHKDKKFRVAFTSGYQVNDLDKISFFPEELHKRYTENSIEIEKGIYIISHTNNLFGDEKFSQFDKPKSMLIMAVEWDGKLESYVVFDSFADKNAFDQSTARILNKFREHAVSAISKAQSLKELQEKNAEIIRTQEQLVTQQKLASLGALTAGIAHEIKNPLNFVNNFAEISNELIDELKLELQNDNKTEALTLAEYIKQNLEKINQHGKRADSIVKGMLLHSRGNAGEKILTDINYLLNQYVDLAYHGLRAQNKDFNITIEKDYDESLEKINVVQQDISRVFLNIINNACYAANEKKNQSGNDFAPMLKVTTKNLNNKVEIRIWDNGNGIPKSIREKLFSPFFTTKPTGEGTGLGLSLSYDIITKGHGGEIKFESEEGKFTVFIIRLNK